jgi:hypothetical protein
MEPRFEVFFGKKGSKYMGEWKNDAKNGVNLSIFSLRK